VLTDIPHVERVQTTLYELVEADRDAHTTDDGDMREIADALRDRDSGDGR
jgi:hypothetical protein